MTYDVGWAALNLEMPDRVPRTEYSAEFHWPLVKQVCGIDITSASTFSDRIAAMRAFMIAWNYDIFWSTSIDGNVFGDMRTRMGHATYASGGEDYDERRSCPFKEPEDVYAFDPFEAYGEVDIRKAREDFEKDYRFKCEMSPNAVNMTGVYVTCVSGLIDILGWDMLLMALGEDGEAFSKFVNRYAEWILQYFTALAESSVPVAGVHDDMVWTAGPFTHPDWYRTVVFPIYRKLFAPLREAGKKIVYTCDGNFTMFVDDLVKAGANAFIMEPATDMALIAEKYGRTHTFIGNADTRVLLLGSRADIRREVERCMRIGKPQPGFVMAVGNHIPPNTPVENAMYYNEVYNELMVR